jgi:hypothetical protein
MNEPWNPLTYHPVQSKLMATLSKRVTVCASRRCGKTEVIVRKSILYTMGHSRSKVIIFEPTYAQCKRVIFSRLIQLVPRKYVDSINLSDMTIFFSNGSIIFVASGEAARRYEGLDYDWAVVDESSDQILTDLLGITILPALSRTNGSLYVIGVPKPYGPGAVKFKELCDNPLFEHYHWSYQGLLSEEVVETIRSTTSADIFDSQFNALWVKSSRNIFKSFSESNIIDEHTQSCSDLHVSWDFNVNNHSVVIAGINNDVVTIFDEIRMNNSTTQIMLNELWSRYPHYKRYKFYGDASSRNRHTSASMSDFIQLKNDRRFDASVYFPSHNPPVRDRFASTNIALCNARGERQLFIHNRCKYLLGDLKMLCYDDNGNQDLRDPEAGHMSDALGYMIHYLYPVKVEEIERIMPAVYIDIIKPPIAAGSLC